MCSSYNKNKMAEGVYNQAESLRLESDDFHEYPCLPCAKDNRNVAAIKYCVDCDENICDKCVSAHNKYAGMKGHQVSDTIKTSTSQGGPGLPSQRCDTHAGKLIDVYCADHDFVGCSTCIAIEHRSCEDVKFIPDVAYKLERTKELQDLESEVKRLEKRIDALKQQKVNCIHNLNQDKERIVHEISVSRQKINDRLDQMQAAMLKEVELFFRKKNETVDAVVSEINCVNDKIKETQEELNDNKDRNDSALFVELMTARKIIRSNSDILKLLEDTHFINSTALYLSREIENILQITSSFAYLSDIPVFSSSPTCCEHNIRLEIDMYKCEIRNIFLTKTDDIILTDIANMNVKVFDTNYVAKEYFVTSWKPFGVCEIDDSRLAITFLDKKCVQFVSRNPMNLEETIWVGDNCRGINYYADKLYVGCGGLDNGERPGRIEVYDMKGTLLNSYHDSLVRPWYISLSSVEAKLFVSDFKTGSICSIDLINNSTEILEIPNITRPSGCCCIDATKQLLVCGLQSNSIVLKSEKEPTRTLLTEKDGVVKPRAILFDKKQSRLIVSLDSSDFIQVYIFKE